MTQRHRETTSLVFIGPFSPAMFHPGWFSANNLIADEEAKAADISIIHPSIAQFRTEKFHIKVEEERFELALIAPERPIIQDLAKKMFVECLPAVPVRSLGINLSVMIDTQSFAIRDRIGKRLAPQDTWGDLSRIFESPDGKREKHGGLMMLVMRQNWQPDDQAGYVQFSVGSTSVLPETGVSVDVNSHFECGSAENLTGSDKLVEILDSRFEFAIDHAQRIVERIEALCAEEGKGV